MIFYGLYVIQIIIVSKFHQIIEDERSLNIFFNIILTKIGEIFVKILENFINLFLKLV